MYLLIRERVFNNIEDRTRFTFHNVSINSGTVPMNKVVNIIFTFHNVSINSRLKVRLTQIEQIYIP